MRNILAAFVGLVALTGCEQNHGRPEFERQSASRLEQVYSSQARSALKRLGHRLSLVDNARAGQRNGYMVLRCGSVPPPGSIKVPGGDLRYANVLPLGDRAAGAEVTIGFASELSHDWPAHLTVEAGQSRIPVQRTIEYEDDPMIWYDQAKSRIEDPVFRPKTLTWRFLTPETKRLPTDYQFRQDLYQSGRWIGSLFGSAG